jgi:predicted dehydrogenase
VGSVVAPAIVNAESLATAAEQQATRPFTNKPVTCIILGAGSRGNTYAAWSKEYPEQMRVVGVAEPIPSRQERFARMYDIPVAHRFPSWDDALAVPKFADAILITTPDQLHHGPAMRGLELGYDILLEKPIATTWQHCSEILAQHARFPRIVTVCHVLRYTTYFRKLREVVAPEYWGGCRALNTLSLWDTGTRDIVSSAATGGTCHLLPDDPRQILSRSGSSAG